MLIFNAITTVTTDKEKTDLNTSNVNLQLQVGFTTVLFNPAFKYIKC